MKTISESTPVTGGLDLFQSGWEKGLRSPLTLRLIGCGAVGAFLFTVTYSLESVMRAGYDAWQQPVSALSLGPGGWVQQVNFVVFGILMMLSAFGWYRFLTPGRGAIWFSLFQGIAGLCLIGTGVFSMDPFPGYSPGATLALSTLHGTLHSSLAWVLICTLALGCFTLAKRFWHTPHRRGWGVYSAITGAQILVYWGVFVLGVDGPASGVMERLSAGSHALWLCLLVMTLFFEKRSQRLHA
jgi:hypothetical protein